MGKGFRLWALPARSAVLIVSFFSIAAFGQGKAPTLQGLWIMNARESVWPASMPGGAPFDHSMHVHDDGVNLTITNVVRHSEDETTITIWRGAWDGKEHQAPEGPTKAFRRIDAD